MDEPEDEQDACDNSLELVTAGEHRRGVAKVGPEGFELTPESEEKQGVFEAGGAKCGALSAPDSPIDADLNFWLEACPVDLSEVVKVDYQIPGCPPSGEAFWQALLELLEGKPIELGYSLIKYD